jgi:hypothetical protein
VARCGLFFYVEIYTPRQDGGSGRSVAAKVPLPPFARRHQERRPGRRVERATPADAPRLKSHLSDLYIWFSNGLFLSEDQEPTATAGSFFRGATEKKN